MTFTTGNGNNLAGYSNERIDGIIASMAVISDPKELARLLGGGADRSCGATCRRCRSTVSSGHC